MVSNFKFVNEIVVRTPTSRAGWDEGLMFQLPSIQEFTKNRSSLSRTIWEKDPIFRQAIRIAKPTLYQNLTNQWGSLKGKTDRALQNYAGRYLFRATPFGAFAGIGYLKFSETGKNACLTPIGITLTSIGEEIEQSSKDKITSSNVFIDDLVVDDGCRNWVLSPNSDGSFKQQYSIRSTSLLELVKTHAKKPVNFQSLSKLVQEKTNADRKSSQKYLSTLIELGVLKAEEGQTESYTQNFSLGRSRDTLLELLDNAEDQAVDMRIDCTTSFDSEEVKVLTKLAELAANSLCRYRVSIPENPHLSQYRSFLVDRYGDSAVIPLTTLFNPGIGAGSPNNYRAPGRSTPISSDYKAAARDEDENKLALRKLAQSKSEQLFNSRLRGFLLRGTQLPGTTYIDTLADIHGKSVIEGGIAKFVLTETGCSPHSKAISRFFRLFQESDETASATAQYRINREGDRVKNYLVEFDPPTTSAKYVSKTERFPDARYVFIGKGLKGGIGLSDIGVKVRSDGMFLIDMRNGQEVVFDQQSMLNPLSAPDIVRFLLDVSSERCLQPVAFSWMGLETEFDYLPRVEIDDVVFSRARWSYQYSVDGTYDDFKLWTQSVGLPAVGFDATGDNLAPVDLSDDKSLMALWERHAARKTDVIICECIGNEVDSKVASPFLEYVIPVQCTLSVGEPNTEHKISDPKVVDGGSEVFQSPSVVSNQREETIWPNEKWARHDFFMNEVYFDSALFCIQDAFASLKETLQRDRLDWYYVRYGEGGNHLRIRCDAPLAVGDESGLKGIDLHAWLLDALSQSVVVKNSRISAYRPEYERYESELGISEYHEPHVLSTSMILASSPNGMLSQNVVNQSVLRSLFEYTERLYPGAFSQFVDSIPRYLATSERKRRLRSHRQEIDSLLILAESVRAFSPGETRPFSNSVLHVLVHMHLNRLGIKPKEERDILGMLSAANGFYQKRKMHQ